MKKILIISLSLVLSFIFNASADEKDQLTCREDSDCVCEPSSEQTESCGKPGQTLACLGGRCQVIFEQNSREEECVRLGGEWGTWGYDSPWIGCILPEIDKGKECKNGSDCRSGICLPDTDLTDEQRQLVTSGNPVKVSAKCSESRRIYGCFPTVEDGYATSILCND